MGLVYLPYSYHKNQPNLVNIPCMDPMGTLKETLCSHPESSNSGKRPQVLGT